MSILLPNHSATKGKPTPALGGRLDLQARLRNPEHFDLSARCPKKPALVHDTPHIESSASNGFRPASQFASGWLSTHTGPHSGSTGPNGAAFRARAGPDELLLGQ